MIKLWFAPRTRSVRVRWLLEELGVPHDLVRVDFNRPAQTFAQSTPLGKLPVIGTPNAVTASTHISAKLTIASTT